MPIELLADKTIREEAVADRYFVESPIVGSQAVLVGSEAHHLLHVMRAKSGTRVTLFDGGGDEFTSLVGKLGRSEVELQVIERHSIDRELPYPMVVGVALPKGDRQKWLVEKLTELGATQLVPLETERGVAQPTDAALARLARGTIEASKQCGRNKLLTISDPQPLASFLASAPTDAIRWFAHPGGKSVSRSEYQAHWIAIGPEGGFSESEAAAAMHHGWPHVSLGPRILRIETAALTLAGLAACGMHGMTN